MTRLLRNYRLMLKWQALSSKTILPISLVVQLMVAFGFVIGSGIFISLDYPEYCQVFNHRRADNQPTDDGSGVGAADGRRIKNRRHI